MAHLIDHLEQDVDWGKVFGVVEDLYTDDGFTSRADNFITSTCVELALEKFSNLKRVDQIGYDFTYGDLKVELKMRKGLFYKRRPNATQAVKMKNFQGNKKTLNEFKEQSTFDYCIILDLTNYQVIVVEDETIREKYYEDGDGVFVKLDLGDYYKCDIGEVKPVQSQYQLSKALDRIKQEWIGAR